MGKASAQASCLKLSLWGFPTPVGLPSLECALPWVPEGCKGDWEDPSTSFALVWMDCPLEGWGERPGPVSLPEGLPKACWAQRRQRNGPLHLSSQHLWAMGETGAGLGGGHSSAPARTFTTSWGQRGPRLRMPLRDKGDKRYLDHLQCPPPPACRCLRGAGHKSCSPGKDCPSPSYLRRCS